ncbi:sulfatase-like hydrolase/transferase [Planctomycetota bacterium]|nr:sulfatase-like hydrolase/transferase [Planctomycetota bacterium]
MPQSNHPPHILLLTADEHAPQIMGCMGDPLVRTPNLDRLAQHGTIFENAYCPNPICVPGRYATMTGKYIRDLGSLHYGDPLNPQTWTYPKHFTRAGYQTTCVGKMHFMGLEQMHGWMFRPFGDMELVHGHPLTPGFTHDPYQHTIPQGNTLADWVRLAGHGDGGFIMFDESTTRETCLNLKDYFTNRQMPIFSPDRPLLFQASWKTPHWPFEAPEELYDYYRQRISMPLIDETPSHLLHPYASHEVSSKMDISDEQILNARAAYWALVEFIDQQIGQVLNTLEQLNILDQFLIIYYSDHGELIGNHGYWGKSRHHEHSSRVPFLISHPTLVPQNKRIKTNVSTIDLFPTLCDYANLPIPHEENLRGTSLKPLIDADTPPQEFEDRIIISEYFNPSDEEGWVLAKQHNIKYVHYFRNDYTDQLFDLTHDPHEKLNLIGNPNYTNIEQKLRQAINDLPEPYKFTEDKNYYTPETQQLAAQLT